jgi:hypothetical protein
MKDDAGRRRRTNPQTEATKQADNVSYLIYFY